MSEELEELKRQLELREREVAHITSELESARKEATATLQKMLDFEADQACERASKEFLHQSTVKAIESIYQSICDEMTAEVERLKMENLNLKEALKASQNN